MRPAIELEFSGARRGLTLVGALLLAVGAAASTAVCWEYRAIVAHRAGLELRLAALNAAKRPPISRAEEIANDRAAVSMEQAAVDLATPWTVLLSELEQVSKEMKGEVAVLAVEPDHAKHTVRVTAEARTLSLALAYVQRLQSSRSLNYPMLDRHETRADDAQHPVRFELTGEWKDLP